MSGVPRAALDLLTLQAEVLYVHDDAGRLLRVNEPGGPPAPWRLPGATGGRTIAVACLGIVAWRMSYRVV